MNSREEKLYAIAFGEIETAKMDQGVWGKAFSESLGDEQRAKALYVKFRVDQLERQNQNAVAEFLRRSRAEIVRGKSFVCPYCEVQTTALGQFVSIFSLEERHYCRSCGAELRWNSASHESQTRESSTKVKSNNSAALTGFVLGLVSAVFYYIGIIPILAIVFSSVGLASFKPEVQKNKWMAGAGLAPGVFYTLMMLSDHVHTK